LDSRPAATSTEGTHVSSMKVATLAVALSAVAAALAPPAGAAMNLGNYDVLTNRYTMASWYWFVARCQPIGAPAIPDCVHVSAAPRLKFYNYYDGDAHLADGRYTLIVDVSDGLECLPGVTMPTHETWSWDAVTLAGTIDSEFDQGCFGGPPGSQSWTFQLQRI
jgi:hypothetical protein